MSTASIQSLIEQVRNETQLHGNTRQRIASLLTQLNSEKLDRPAVESIISEITNLSPLFFDQFGNILSSLTQGWTVQFSDEEYIDSLDGRKVIRKVTGYVGGTGTLPAALSANIGKYFAKAGGFTTSKADATIYETSELLIKEAKQGNAPTPYVAVTYPDGLFEKYQVKTPLTMPNSWGSAVTQAELDANYVFFDVKNGVISKDLSKKISTTSKAVINELTGKSIDADLEKVFYIEKEGSINLLDYTKADNTGYYRVTDGVKVVSDSIASSGLIRVEYGQKYTQTAGSNNITFWDKDGSFVSGLTSSGTFTVPNNPLIMYVRISVYKTTTPLNKAMLVKGEVLPPTYDPFIATKYTLPKEYYNVLTDSDLDEINVDLDKVMDMVVETSLNLINPEDIDTTGYYSSTGQRVTSSLYGSTGLIKVERGVQYIKSSGSTHITFWDKSGNFISGLSGTSFTVPNNPSIEYARASLAQPYNIQMFVKGTVLPSIFTPYKKSIILPDDVYEYKLGGNYGIERVPIGFDLFNEDDVVVGEYYRRQDGILIKPAAGITRSGAIIINNGVTLERIGGGADVAVFDKDMNFLQGFNTTTEKTFTVTAKNAKFLFFSFASSISLANIGLKYKGGNLDLFKTTQRLIIENATGGGSEVIDEGLLRYNMARSKDFLRVKSPVNDGSSDAWADYQNTHPSVVQFDTAWNGYKYWMAYTPYPNSNSIEENPCIVASNNGIKWVEVAGIVNPISPTPVGGGYNSDTHIIYRPDLNHLEVWYRQAKPEPNPGEVIKRRIINSTLAVSAEQVIIETDGSLGLQFISPSVIYEDNKYKMWIMKSWYIYYQESADLITWTPPVELKSDGENIRSWHPCVVKRGNKYILINNNNPSISGSNGDIRYSTSSDGINFTKEVVILNTIKSEFALDGRGVYRACPIWFENGSVGVIYGMVKDNSSTYQRKWTLGLTVGKDFLSLVGIDRQTLEYNNALY